MMNEAALGALRGKTLTVRELLAQWGYRIRNHESVPRVRLDLERVGLTTDPHFTTGPMTQTVRVVPVAEEGEDTPDQPDSQGTSVDVSSDELPQVSMQVRHLPAACGGVVRVAPTAEFNEATTLMMKYDYSQIPVLAGQSSLRGVVSWKSIARMFAFNRHQSLENATEQDVQIVSSHDDLLMILPVITAHDFVLVRNEHGHVCGILTTADLAMQFENVARPFFAIGEIERRLRGCLSPVFDGDTVKKVTKGRWDRVDQMMFGHYLDLLRKPDCWRQLDWPAIDQGLFVEELDSVRKIRNEVMHFQPTPLSPSQEKQLAQFLGMLRRINP
jgi:hypothetical protein